MSNSRHAGKLMWLSVRMLKLTDYGKWEEGEVLEIYFFQLSVSNKIKIVSKKSDYTDFDSEGSLST